MACYEFFKKANDKIDIQAFTSVATDLGGQTTAWASENQVWAVVEPTSGKELYKYGQIAANVTHKFIIRYNSAYKDVTESAKRKIVFDDRNFSIVYSRNLSSDLKSHGQHFQEFLCVENGDEIEN